MKLQNPTKEFIEKMLEIYTKEEGPKLDENLLKLFKTFQNDENKYDVLIKVASLNKIYSTAITNINPVVEQITKVTNENKKLTKLNDFTNFVDKISRVEWTNQKGETFSRNNLSFASKYVHFLSDYKTPIYDSYIWIIIKGYLGQKNGGIKNFNDPENFQEFYTTFQKFKKEMKLEEYSNYKIDKFLWQYGKSLIKNIEKELNINLGKSKSELKRRIKAHS